MRLPPALQPTNILLILFHAYTLWLSLRIAESSFNPRWLVHGVLFGLSCFSAQSYNDRTGVSIPSELTVLIPVYLDDMVPARYPMLARRMGYSPCDRRLAPNDARGRCILGKARGCYDHALYAEKGGRKLEAVRACQALYGASVEDAKTHWETCHPVWAGEKDVDRQWPLLYPAVTACGDVRRAMFEARAQCAAEKMLLLGCVLEYGVFDEIAEEMGKMPGYDVRREKSITPDGKKLDTVHFKIREEEGSVAPG